VDLDPAPGHRAGDPALPDHPRGRDGHDHLQPAFYDSALVLYKSPLFRFAELLIFFAVLFHAVNGCASCPGLLADVMQRQRQLAWAAAIVTVLAMIPVTWMMVAPMLGLAEEPGVQRHIGALRGSPTRRPASATAHGEVAR
jgi:succinate dehydrogenase hydrophobic anchor subunit